VCGVCFVCGNEFLVGGMSADVLIDSWEWCLGEEGMALDIYKSDNSRLSGNTKVRVSFHG
jgi:hypothetical protein